MTAQTGFEGDVLVIDTVDEVRKQLRAGEVQVAVFTGFEFAWGRAKNPDLRPLVVSAPDPDALKVVLVVAADSPVKDLNALKGRKFALPSDTSADAIQYLTRKVEAAGSTMSAMFGAPVATTSIEDGLDDVVDGKADAALVDRAALRAFERRKPSRAAKLKPLLESAPLPPCVLAVCAGKLDDEAANKVKTGLTTAHQSEAGTRLLRQLRIQRFDAPSSDFDKLIAEAARQVAPPQ